MIVTNIRIEEPSDNPSLAQLGLDWWSRAFGLGATMATLASPFGVALVMMRLGRAWYPGSAGARTD